MIEMGSPWYLLFLAAIPLWLLGRRSWLGPASLAFSSGALLDPVAGKGRARFTWIPSWMKCAGLLLLVAGLARPVFREDDRVLEREGIDLFLLVDVSSSMSENILDGSRSNLEVAKHVVRGFVERRDNDRIGLISFARFPKLVCPLTLEQEAVAAFIDRLECTPRGSEMDGTAIGAALAEAARRFEGMRGRGAEAGADRVAVLVTDGEENQFYVEPRDAAKLCADLGIKVYTVAAAPGGGEQEGSGMDAAALDLHEEVARITGGRFAGAATAQDLEAVYAGIDTLEKRPLEARFFSERHDLYPWLIVPAAILLFLEFLLARVFFLRMP